MFPDWIADFVVWLTPPRIETILISLFSAVIGTAGGALGGAWAAQKIGDRAARRKEIRGEILRSNEAIEVLHGIINSYLNFKQQHVRGLVAAFRAQRLRVEGHLGAIAAGRIAPGAGLEVGEIDFSMLMPLKVNIRRLQELVLERLTISGRPRSMLGVLDDRVDSLNSFINQRNRWIETYQAQEELLGAFDRVVLVFGLRAANGNVDASYREFMDGISKQTDDCIQYTKFLIEDVTRHAKVLRSEYVKRFDKDIPHNTKVYLDDPELVDLLPNADDYALWTRMFVARIAPTRGRWLGRCRLASRFGLRALKQGVFSVFEK